MKKALETRDEPTKLPSLTYIFAFMTLDQPAYFTSCASRVGPKWLMSSEIILHPPENLKGTWKSSSYSSWGQWSKARFKSFLSAFPLIISFHIISYYPSITQNTRKSAFEEAGLLCTLRDPTSQPRALLTSERGKWALKTDTEFSANRILVSKFLMHIHRFGEFVFLGTVKTVMQLSHLLERVTKLTWETVKLSRLF